MAVGAAVLARDLLAGDLVVGAVATLVVHVCAPVSQTAIDRSSAGPRALRSHRDDRRTCPRGTRRNRRPRGSCCTARGNSTARNAPRRPHRRSRTCTRPRSRRSSRRARSGARPRPRRPRLVPILVFVAEIFATAALAVAVMAQSQSPRRTNGNPPVSVVREPSRRSCRNLFVIGQQPRRAARLAEPVTYLRAVVERSPRGRRTRARFPDGVAALVAVFPQTVAADLRVRLVALAFFVHAPRGTPPWHRRPGLRMRGRPDTNKSTARAMACGGERALSGGAGTKRLR